MLKRTFISSLIAVALLCSNAFAVESEMPTTAELSVGYRFVSSDDNPQRAGEYEYLHSSIAGKGEIKGIQSGHHFLLDGQYLNEKDYLFEGDYDYLGLVRVHGLTESLYHNLDHRPSTSADRPDAIRPGRPTTPWIHFSDQNPGEKYYREINQSEIRLRGKLPDYPAHINLEYWRFARKGSEQQHFVDEGGGTGATSCVQCHVSGKKRKLDRVTDQFKVGTNAHLGHVDISLEYLLRDFEEREDTPVDAFGTSYSRFTSTTYRQAGLYQHDGTPDSRLQSGELKLHSSLSGGLVAAGNFSIGQRENRSSVSDVGPIKAKSDFYKGATDLTWQPSPQWTVHLRYRLLDIDNNNSSFITANGSPQVSNIEVRNSIDISQDTYEASLVYRPYNAVRMRVEGSYVQLHRGQAGEATTDPLNPNWQLPQDEDIYSATLDLSTRTRKKGMPTLQAKYTYQHSNDPAYGASAEDRHELFSSIRWPILQTLGLFGNAQLIDAENDRHRRVQTDGSQLFDYRLDHQQTKINASAGIWATPAERANVHFYYGYFQQKTDQDILFGSDPSADPAAQVNVLDEDVPYRHRVHSLNLIGTLQLKKNLTARVEGRYVNSSGSFRPDFNVYQAPYFGFGNPEVSPVGLKELSEIEMRQYGTRFSLEWKDDNNWAYGAQYALDDYDDRLDDRLDGRVQVLLLHVGRNW